MKLHLDDKLETFWSQIDAGVCLGKQAEVDSVIGIHLGSEHLGSEHLGSWGLPFQRLTRVDGEVLHQLFKRNRI